jgi:hypothetical protein
MASSTVNLKALGLNFSGNALELSPGSLIEANNVIIRRDDVIESRRGYKLFGEEIPNSEKAKQLMTYRQRILRHYGDKIAYQDGTLNNGKANFTEFDGSYSEVQSGLRIKFNQAKNGNFYFTTNEGIKKISATNASEFTSASGYITQAGGIKALDLQATLNTTFGDQESFLTENSTVAYKLVWGKIDANNVELLGTPSERVVVYNPLKTLLQADFNRLLGILDLFNSTNSLITDGTTLNKYTKLVVTKDTNAFDLRAKMIALAKKIDEDLLFANDTGTGATAYEPLNINTVTASSGIITVNFLSTFVVPADYFAVGDKINLVDFKSNNLPITNINGNQTVASVTAGSVTFTARDYTISNPLGISGVIASHTADVSGIVTITTTVAHGLTDQQKVVIQNTAYPSLNTTLTATVKSPTTFTVSVASGSVSAAGTTGIWGVAVDSLGLAKIESNKYRSIAEPIEVVAAEDTGIVDVRGTGAQLFAQQTYLSAIISRLKAESTNVINSAYSTTIGLSNFTLTTRASVDLEFTVPHNIDSTYYYKLYRTETTQVNAFFSSPLEDLQPSVDYRLVLQNYYDSNLKSSTNTLSINDNVPPEFLNKENLYTNVNTSGGEDAKPNDYPPFAHDINRFKGYTFYANTKLKQIKDLELLGVAKLKDELDAGGVPKVLISDGSSFNNCEIKFVRGVKQTAAIVIPASPVNAPVTKTFLPANVNTITDVITIASHGFIDNTPIIFKSTNALPSGIVENTTYYVINATLNTFQISTSIGGSAVDITSIGSGTHTASFNTNYIDINSANNVTKYRIWFDLTGSDIQPDSSSRILIRVFLAYNTPSFVSFILTNILNSLVNDFTANDSSGVVGVSNLNDGPSTITFGAALGPSGTGFTILITKTGVGESVSGKTAVISSNDLLLPSVATEQATKSFIRVLNRNTADQVDNPSVGFDTYAYYSGTNPGLFLLEGTVFVDNPFYLIANNTATGVSFSPDISPLNTNTVVGAITSSGSLTNKATLTFSSPHLFLNNETIVISNSNSTPNIDGVYVVEYINATQLKINLVPSADITGTGTTFSYTKSNLAEFSDNYKRPNRIYYSKFEQPEAVSVNILTGNFIDVGSEEKEILRIFPLRDSLFVFKEDGLFRLSAETEPFTVSLFDSSCILIAPDSVAVSQNLVYCWTSQGISTVSESGVSIASRPIDIEILKIQSANYPSFSTATFGIGYESDNSYIVWSVSKPSDAYATQAFRYSSLTGTWTKYTKTNNCGILNSTDDRLYLGLPTESFIEQERKSFTREDYADREYDFSIGVNNYFGNVINLSSTANLKAGDVLTQTQTLTVYQFNSLLNKLDDDVGVTDTNYYSLLKASGGDNLRTKILALATKLDLDAGVASNDFYNTIDTKSGSITAATLTSPTVITSNNHGLVSGRIITIIGANTFPDINGNHEVTVINANTFSIPINLISVTSLGTWITKDNDFNDIAACYNKIIDKLNSDANIAFSNYLPIQGTSLQEAVIVSVDYIFKKVTLNKILDYVQGPIIVYSAIVSSVVYAPNTFGDPLSYKQIREATAMFANKAFTLAELSFSTDLLPAFTGVEFVGSGSGLFGHDEFGGNFFGGVSNSVPFRTIVPANCQRCRYLNVKFSHSTAREQYALYGITLTGKTFSTRAYR